MRYIQGAYFGTRPGIPSCATKPVAAAHTLLQA